MKLIDTDETILIVTGSDIPAEMNDRPVAYGLKSEIDRLGAGQPWRSAVVVSDRWYADSRLFHLCASVAIGGPGVNAIAAEWVDELPMLSSEGERIFVQGAWDADRKRASLWGLDRVATAMAVESFVRAGHCADFLNHAWRLTGLGRSRIDLA
jgi:hypothetical protein